MQDFAARMREIKSALDTGVKPPEKPDEEQEVAGKDSSSQKEQQPDVSAGAGAESAAAAGEAEQTQKQQMSLEDKENLLDELMDIVSSIDFARGVRFVCQIWCLSAVSWGCFGADTACIPAP